MRPGHGGTISRLCACRRGHSDGAATIVTSAALIVSAHGTGEAPPRRSWLGVRPGGTHAPFPPGRSDRRTVSWHGGSARRTPSVHSAHASWPAASWWIVSGPFEFIAPATVLPSVDATREHVPPVLHAVELPISRRRSDHCAAVEALVSSPTHNLESAIGVATQESIDDFIRA